MNKFLEDMAYAINSFVEKETKCGVESALILSSSKEFDAYMAEKYLFLGEQNVFDCKEIYVVKVFPNGDDDKYDVDEHISLAKSISSSVQVKYLWYDSVADFVHLDCTVHTSKVNQTGRRGSDWRGAGQDLRDTSRSFASKARTLELNAQRKFKGGNVYA